MKLRNLCMFVWIFFTSVTFFTGGRAMVRSSRHLSGVARDILHVPTTRATKDSNLCSFVSNVRVSNKLKQ
jgi:hypothetical protein